MIRSSFIRNVLTLFTGNLLAQAIPICISPILTRLYSPDDFGTLAIFISISMIFGVVATGRFELAIGLPMKEEEADEISKLCYAITILSSALLFFCIIIFYDTILLFIGNARVGFWLYLVPINVLFIGLAQTILYRLNRKKKFRQMSQLKITQTSIISSTHLAMGILHLTKAGLISGHLIGSIFGVLAFQRAHGIQSINFQSIGHVFRKYKGFLLFNAPTSLLDRLSTSLPILFISKIFSKDTLGHFALVERVIGAPVSLISSAISQVLLQRLTEIHNHGGSVIEMVRKVFIVLFSLAIIPFSLLALTSEEIFSLVFGSEWREAGEYVSILSWAYLARFVVSPLSIIFISRNKLRSLMIWQITYFLSTFGVVLYSYFFLKDLRTFFVLYTINEIIMYSIYLLLIFKAAKN